MPLSRPEIRTIIKNAFALPGLATRHEHMVANEMHKHKGPKAGKLPYNPSREVGYGSDPEVIRRRRALIFSAIGSEPISRAELGRRLPEFSDCVIRNDLCRMVTNGQIQRIGESVSITYVRREER